MKTEKIYTRFYVVLSMFIWGLSYVWIKVVLQYYNPITMVFLRFAISFILLFIIIKLFKKSEKIHPKDYWLFIVSALFNPFFYFLCESYGLKYVSSTISAVIIATIPVFTPIIAYYSLKEKLSFLNIFGLLISFLGIIIMLVNKDLSLNASPKGILFLFLAVITAIIFSVMLKKLTVNYSPLTIITYLNALGAIYFLPLFLIFDFNHFISIKPNFELILSLLQLAVFASSLAYVFYTIAIKNLGVSKANMYANLIPVFTAITSYFVLSELFNLNKIIGMIIVISGVSLSQINKFKKNYKS
ncbi:MAG: DMT family transporter [Bacteroidales bacterium]|nr:DMT family transporter [Bacteroidales bacterium]MCK4406758.1 DMT family transporter [Bacteroidales bacterium]